MRRKRGPDIHVQPDWPKLQWSYNAPNASDAAGKVIVHWFCTPKVAACIDDLARIVTLRETDNVYIVAYINGTQRDSKKLDPIRESEGVAGFPATAGVGVGMVCGCADAVDATPRTSKLIASRMAFLYRLDVAKARSIHPR